MTELSDLDWWSPEAKSRLLAAVQEREASNWKPFFCPNIECNGNPHADGTWQHFHARADQRLPKWQESWLTTLWSSGRGTGKTRGASEITNRVVKRVPEIALVGATGPAVREVMIEGPTGILATAPSNFRPKWEPSRRRLVWPNGAIGHGVSAEEPDRVRGLNIGFCNPAGTLVQAEHGEVPIEGIREGDRVWTRKGLRRVHATGGRRAEVVEVHHEGGSVRVTGDHPIWVNGAWLKAELVQPSDTISVWTNSFTKRLSASHGDSIPLLDDSSIPRAAARRSEPAMSTLNSSDLSLRDSISTTPMVTRQTIDPRTSSLSLRRRTPHSIGARSSLDTPAGGVATSSDRLVVAPASGVLPVRKSRAGSTARGPSEIAKLSDLAKSVEPSFYPVLGTSVVSGVSTLGAQIVYSISVEEEPEFFADGVLVHNSWLDEAAFMPLIEEVWSNLVLALRVGLNPHILVTTTPRPTKWIKALIADPLTIVRRVSTYENLHNLSPVFRQQVLEAFEGTRIGRQELYGEVLEDVEGSLWKPEMIHYIEEARVPDLDRIVVSVDPAGTANARSDETGIVVLGICGRMVYVLADLTGKYSPAGWAEMAHKAHDEYHADAIVAEKNYGADMVRHTLESVGRDDVRVILVESRRGKAIRAEPIVGAYEKELVWHVSSSRTDLVKLESEMVEWVPGVGSSPNRVDALVHGATELMQGFGGPATISNPSKVLRNMNTLRSREYR